MSQPTLDPAALSRRELQYLARELELCRGNAKSDAIVEHVVAFIASNGAGRVQELLGELPDDAKLRTPSAATPAKKTRDSSREGVAPKAIDFGEETPSRKPSRKDQVAAEKNASTTETQAGKTSSAVTVVTPVKTTPKKDSKTKSPADKKESTPTATKKDSKPKGPADKKESTPTATKKDSKTKCPADKKQSTPAAAVPSESSKPKANDTGAKATSTPPRTATVQKSGRMPLTNVSNLPKEATKKTSSGSASVDELVEKAGDLVFVGSDRVKCVTTGHEMKADHAVITSYMSGKSYQRANKKKRSFASFAPMFVDHPDENKAHMLWCSVTQTAIARDIVRVEAHSKGPRYQKEFPQWQLDQAAAVAAEKAKKELMEKRALKKEENAKKRKADASADNQPRRAKAAKA